MNSEKVRDIIQCTQNNMDKMKRESLEKDKVIEEKNQEILRLKIKLEEQENQFYRAEQPYFNLDQERRSIAMELRLISERLSKELHSIKTTVLKDSSLKQVFIEGAEMQSIQSEEHLLKELAARVSSMRELVVMASDITVFIQSE